MIKEKKIKCIVQEDVYYSSLHDYMVLKNFIIKKNYVITFYSLKKIFPDKNI